MGISFTVTKRVTPDIGSGHKHIIQLFAVAFGAPPLFLIRLEFI